MARLTPLPFLLAGLTLASALAGCRGEPSDDPPMLPVRNMFDQERVDPQGYNDYSFFYAEVPDSGVSVTDHRNMRRPPDGTMARDFYDDNHPVKDGPNQEEFTSGMEDDGRYALVVPAAAVTQFGGEAGIEKRGQQRYNIYCAPCHSKIGDGKGTVMMVADVDGKTLVARPGGFPPLPDFTQDRIMHMPDGQVFNTITHGLGNMPAYANQIPTADRWAIVAYLRALQVSQKAMPGRPPPVDQGDKK